MAGNLTTLKDTISLESMVMSREKFVLAFMPDVMNEPPAIVREFEPFEYPHLLVMPEFMMSLNRAHDAMLDVSASLEPVWVEYSEDPNKDLYGRIAGYDIESCSAEPQRELWTIHRMFFTAINSRSGFVVDNDLSSSNYEPLIYSLPGQKLPDNYFCILSLIKCLPENRRKLISNVAFEGGHET